MAEGEGTSFENPTFEPDPLDEDDYGDETTPFFPNGAPTPAFETIPNSCPRRNRNEDNATRWGARYALR